MLVWLASISAIDKGPTIGYINHADDLACRLFYQSRLARSCQFLEHFPGFLTFEGYGRCEAGDDQNAGRGSSSSYYFFSMLITADQTPLYQSTNCWKLSVRPIGWLPGSKPLPTTRSRPVPRGNKVAFRLAHRLALPVAAGHGFGEFVVLRRAGRYNVATFPAAPVEGLGALALDSDLSRPLGFRYAAIFWVDAFQVRRKTPAGEIAACLAGRWLCCSQFSPGESALRERQTE